MNSQMRVTGKQVQYGQYPQKTTESTKEDATAQKEGEYDVFTQEQEDDSDMKRMEEQLERIREMRFKKTKPKQTLKHNTADIRMRMLSSNTKMVVRMALSEAYREMATISTCNIGGSYDKKQVEKAMAQIKKVISAGKLKIANLTKEERAELTIKQAKKKLEKAEVQEMKRELVEKKHQNRKKERHVSGRPDNGEKDYSLAQKYIDKYRAECLPDALLPNVGASADAVAAEAGLAAGAGATIDAMPAAAAVSIDTEA